MDKAFFVIVVGSCSICHLSDFHIVEEMKIYDEEVLERKSNGLNEVVGPRTTTDRR